MILYLDSSALIPLLVDEPTSFACAQLWDAADRVVCTRLGYIEAAAALAMAERMGRVTTDEHLRALSNLDVLWSETDVIELGAELMAEAAELARRHGLRGYDATHCAAAIEANGADLVAASGDRRLLAAWQAEGVAVSNTSA